MCKQEKTEVAKSVQFSDRQREKINEAVNRLVQFFGEEVSIGGIYQAQALAMTEVMSMMTHFMNNPPDYDVMLQENVADSMHIMTQIIGMLQPFADVAEESWYQDYLTKPRKNYGNDNPSI